MKNRIFALIALVGWTLTLGVVPALAEPVNQDITLKPGWNAVFLQVQPDSKKPDEVFAALTDLISVWAWNPQAGTVEFIQNPNEVVNPGPEWMIYHPGNPIIRNLHAIYGNKAYLIEMGGSDDVTWTVRGEPLVPDIDWKPNSFNFVGFHIENDSAPFFQDFFASSPAHAGKDIYVLDNTTASWVNITDPLQAIAMKRGEGFWIYCQGSSTFNGPIKVQLEQGEGLHFGTLLSAQEIVLENDSTSDHALAVTISDANVPLDPLYLWVLDPSTATAEWQPFSEAAPSSLDAGESHRMRIGVKREGLAAGQSFASNLRVKGAGIEIEIPVSATGIDLSGLWVGEATINKVTDFLDEINPETDLHPVNHTGTEFRFRLILHVADGGQVRLLNQVVEMWQDGSGTEPGQPVLLIDEALTGDYSGIALRGGRTVGRRISAPAFGNFYQKEVAPFGAPVSYRPMTGMFGAGFLSTKIVLPKDDPSNPFIHRYHPDHAEADSYEVSRTVTFEFRDTDADGNPIGGAAGIAWGSSAMGGVYEEWISGLHKEQLQVEGTFVLHKVSDVGTLTTK